MGQQRFKKNTNNQTQIFSFLQQSQTFGQLPVAGYHQQHYSPAAASPVQPQQPQQPQQVNGGYANPAASAGNVSFTQLNQRIPYQNSQSFNIPSNQVWPLIPPRFSFH